MKPQSIFRRWCALVAATGLATSTALAQFTPSAASDAEITAQSVRNKYISPYGARNIALLSSLLSNTNTPFFGGTTNYSTGFFGSGAGLSGAANTLSNAFEAISYANNNGIFEPAARNRLVLMENDLKQNGFWSNVVDILPFYAGYNPSNGATMMGRTYTNKDFSVGTFGLSYTPSPISINVPSMTNGTMVIVYSLPVSCDGGGSLGWGSMVSMYGYDGAFKSNELIYAVADTYPETTFAITNSVNTGSRLPYYHYELNIPGGNYISDAAGPNPLGAAANQNSLQQRVDIISFNTNGNLTYFRNGMMSQAGYGGSSFTNNYNWHALTPFTNFVVGPDFQRLNGTFDGVNLRPTLSNNCAVAMLFNTECSSNMALAITRAARLLDPRRNTAILLGDSLMEANFTNCIESLMLSSPAWSDWYIYNISQGGMSANTLTAAGNNTRRLLFPFLNNLAGLPGINRTKVFWGFGINDFGLIGGTTPQSLWNDTTNTLLSSLMPNTPDFGVAVGTLPILSVTNFYTATGYTSPGPAAINVASLAFNVSLSTNAFYFRDGIWDRYSIYSLYVQQTNNGPGISLDGLHPFNTNGINWQKQLLAVMGGELQPQNVYAPLNSVGGFVGPGLGITSLYSSNVVQTGTYQQTYQFSTGYLPFQPYTNFFFLNGQGLQTNNATFTSVPQACPAGSYLTNFYLWRSSIQNIGANTNLAFYVYTNGVCIASAPILFLLGGAITTSYTNSTTTSIPLSGGTNTITLCLSNSIATAGVVNSNVVFGSFQIVHP